MPYKVMTDSDEEIEAYSQEEVEAMVAEKTQAEIDRIEEEKQAELEALANEKNAMEEELEKLRNKEMNFERVNKKAKGKEIEVSEEIKEQIKALEEKISAVAAQPTQDVKQDFVKQFIGDDKEQLDRFNYYYDKLGSDAKTKEEVTKVAQEALQLASGGQYKPDITTSMYSAAASQDYRSKGAKEVSEESKAIGNLFGITEEDRKKYAKK